MNIFVTLLRRIFLSTYYIYIFPIRFAREPVHKTRRDPDLGGNHGVYKEASGSYIPTGRITKEKKKKYIYIVRRFLKYDNAGVFFLFFVEKELTWMP